MGVTTLLVLDTNVFLHAKQFDQVDWHKLAGVDELVLVVVAVVLGELDQQKWDNPSPILRDRAKRITSAIGKLVRQVPVGRDVAVRDGVALRHIGRGPRLPPEVDPRNRDEVLQASIEELKTPGTRVLFFSLDENAALIARGRGTELLELAEELVVPAAQPEQRQQSERSATPG